MMAARNHPDQIAGLVITQVLQGFSGIASVGCALAAQAAVPHQDLAIATALPLLAAEVGNAIGSSIAGALWRSKMPGYLEQNLNGILNSTEIEAVFASAVTAATYEFGSPARNGIIEAYKQVMQVLLIPALVFCVPALLSSLLIHNYRATDAINAVESRTVEGDTISLDSHNAAIKDQGITEVLPVTNVLPIVSHSRPTHKRQDTDLASVKGEL